MNRPRRPIDRSLVVPGAVLYFNSYDALEASGACLVLQTVRRFSGDSVWLAVEILAPNGVMDALFEELEPLETR